MSIFRKTILTVTLSIAAVSNLAGAAEVIDESHAQPKETEVREISPEEVGAKANWCNYEYFCGYYGCSYRYICW